MTTAVSTLAPIERVAVPLRPRSPSACCDLAVMFYGRHIIEALRLYAAIGVPAVVLVYGLGSFVGTDLTLAIFVAAVATKPLGILTVAAAARRTFGEPFERDSNNLFDRSSRSRRVRDVARSVLTAAATLSLLSLIAAIIDRAYGTGRLSTLGQWPAAFFVLLIVLLISLRGGQVIVERHRPGRSILVGMLVGTVVRTLLLASLGMMLFKSTFVAGIAVSFFWLPIAAWIAMSMSIQTERRALAEIDPALHPANPRRVLEGGDMLGPAFVIAMATCGLWLVVMGGIEFSLTVLGFAGPVTGPVREYFDPEFFEPQLAFAAIVGNPLFAATSVAAGLFAYQVGRLAWFFAYIDARIRRDCWDLELLLAREAKRLEGQ